MTSSITAGSQPTRAKERIVFLDVLRGFALVGILFANILSWSGLKFLPIEKIIELGNIESDRVLYHYLQFFVDTKFYTIFSLLFGVGFCMQISKNRENPGFPRFYMWRLLLLLLIGAGHALVWSGDILALYALMGMLLLALRKIPTHRTVYCALALFFLPIVLDVVYMHAFATQLPPASRAALHVYPDMTPEQVVAGYQSTAVLTVFKTNLHNLAWRWFDFIPDGRPFKVLGLFLLGYYLFSIQFFTVHARRLKVLFTFLAVGLIFTTWSIFIKGTVVGFSRAWVDVADKLVHEIGQITLGLAYICILARLVEAFPKFIVFDWLKNYGRMSLSSYLGHTCLGIIAFYPVVGWGYFGRLTLEQTYYVGVIILCVQLVFCNLWFKYFNFGPVEYLWRCATYRKWYPLRV